MAHGVKDPVDREPQFPLGACSCTLQAFENRLKAGGIVIAPHVNDANRDEDFCMNNALRRQMLHHAPRGEFVVVWMDELAGDGLESFDEAGEVSELV